MFINRFCICKVLHPSYWLALQGAAGKNGSFFFPVGFLAEALRGKTFYCMLLDARITGVQKEHLGIDVRL